MKATLHLVWRSSVCVIYICFSALAVKANDNDEIKKFLQKFHANPKIAMDLLPAQVLSGNLVARGSIDYSKTERLSHKQQVQSLVKANSSGFIPFSAPIENDLASTIVDGRFVITDISMLEDKRWIAGTTQKIPWADSYWPDYKGSIGIRYADDNFPNSEDFMDNYSYVTQNSATEILRQGNADSIDSLSPAEKYDLLVGDTNWSLTEYAWRQGKRYYENTGSVPTWTGICHGWAAAASVDVAVSRNPIEVLSVNNTKITFYPSDIKALQSMLWANASPRARFIGGRCNETDPKRNEVGRIIDPDCVDNNPATFHLVLTNQLGGNGRSFIMDSVFDSEVWNFPLASYSYKYFNPQTKVPTTDFRNAIIPIEEFSIDKFSSYRSPIAKYVIGIVMDDSYVIEISPTRGSQEISPQTTYRHFYDLELDQNFQIIGGEWYSNAHPDFIWTLNAKAQAQSYLDASINPRDWTEASPPRIWTNYASEASRRGQPLLAIINGLLKRE